MQTWQNLSSDKQRTYTTTLADDGKLLCNCKGWTMRRANQARQCSHTKDAVATLGLEVEARGEFVYVIEGAPQSRRVDRATVVAAARQIAKDVRDGVHTFGPGPDGTHVVTTPTLPDPMLASAMTDVVTGATFNQRYSAGWALEQKIDGHRVVTVVIGGEAQAFSRPDAGKAALRRELPPHIRQELRRFPDCILDGEVVGPTGKAWEVTATGTRLLYVVFDVLSVKGIDVKRQPYTYRRQLLLECLRLLPEGQTAITTVESLTPSWDVVQAIWNDGGEGAVLKRLTSTYQEGYRSPDWVKVKKRLHRTLTIIGFKAGKTGPYSSLILRDSDGVETRIKTPDVATYRAIAAAPDTFIGRRVVIAYQEQTPSGAYRHPMFDHFAGPGE